MLPCNHVFETNSIELWLLNQQTKCPVCRYELKKTKSIRIEPESDGTTTNSTANDAPVGSARWNHIHHNLINRPVQYTNIINSFNNITSSNNPFDEIIERLMNFNIDDEQAEAAGEATEAVRRRQKHRGGDRSSRGGDRSNRGDDK